MSTTTTTTTTTAKPATSSVAASAKFKTFALVFGLTFTVMYVICDLFSLPLFTYHPATNRVGWGWEPGRSGEGPAMYWYGWTAMCFVVGTIVGLVATLVPERKIPQTVIWGLLLVISALFWWEAHKSGWDTAKTIYAAISLGVALIFGFLATRLPEETLKKAPLLLVWVIPIVVFIPLAYSLMPFWTK